MIYGGSLCLYSGIEMLFVAAHNRQRASTEFGVSHLYLDRGIRRPQRVLIMSSVR